MADELIASPVFSCTTTFLSLFSSSFCEASTLGYDWEPGTLSTPGARKRNKPHTNILTYNVN